MAPANSPSSASAEGTNDDDDPVRPLLPPRLELLSLANFDDVAIAAMNGALKGNTRYRFEFAEGGHRTYYGGHPRRGPHTPADDRTSMYDIETASWVPIPSDQTAPHTPEDFIEAVNDVRIKDRLCIAYVHPEASKAFKALNASRQPNDPEIHPLHVYDLSEEDEAALVAGLDGSEAVYKFRKPWEEGHNRYEGSLPREGVPNVADARTEIWDDNAQKYRMLAAGFTAPHDPQDYVDAVNWDIVRTEKHRRSAIRLAGRLRPHNNDEEQEKAEVNKQVETGNGNGDWEDWEAPDPLIESDLSGSDYKEARRDLEKMRAWRKSRGQSVTDTEEDDTKIDEEDAEEQPDLDGEEQEEARSKAKGQSVTDTEEEDDTRFNEEADEEERNLEHDEQEEAHSKAARVLLSNMKREGKAPTSSDALWQDLRASFTPSQLDAAAVLSSYGFALMPNALLPVLEEVSPKKPSLMETALYPMFGEIVWQVAYKLGHLYGRSSDFAMEKAGLLRKEKRAPNYYNIYKTFASRMKPEQGDHG